tara:strand:- start:1109 stop:1597 length:489 start_codon:yes stop_codon:yes gene_type:complete
MKMVEAIGRLHKQLESLRVEYERFFLGLEKRPPLAMRAQVSRDIRRYTPQNNAVDKFKHRNLIQRLVTLEQYWERIQRAIDAGTFARDVARADYRQSRRPSTGTNNRDSDRAAPSAERKAATEKRTRDVSDAASDFLSKLGSLSGGGDAIGMRGTARKKPNK